MKRLARYVVLKPVRAKIVALPEDFRWSSYRAPAGLEPAPEWLRVSSLRPYFREADSWRGNYVEFVHLGIVAVDRISRGLRRNLPLQRAVAGNSKAAHQGEPPEERHPSRPAGSGPTGHDAHRENDCSEARCEGGDHPRRARRTMAGDRRLAGSARRNAATGVARTSAPVVSRDCSFAVEASALRNFSP
jgi:hypothetical protein